MRRDEKWYKGVKGTKLKHNLEIGCSQQPPVVNAEQNPHKSEIGKVPNVTEFLDIVAYENVGLISTISQLPEQPASNERIWVDDVHISAEKGSWMGLLRPNTQGIIQVRPAGPIPVGGVIIQKKNADADANIVAG